MTCAFATHRFLKRPHSVYINWSAYDELSDTVPLTEELAMCQLEHLLRLRAQGVQFDTYMMDAFWYAPDGGYRTWRKPHWPAGGDQWLAACAKSDIRPGLWLMVNMLLAGLRPYPAWAESLDVGGRSYCLYDGPYLEDLLHVMSEHYDAGVRAFKFDFADFNAATPAVAASMLPAEIWQANVHAFRTALVRFRQAHPDVLLIGYNGFCEALIPSPIAPGTLPPFRRFLDPRWLEAFDSLYSIDPQPSDWPCVSFWRSKDIFSDQKVRLWQQCGLPSAGIDNAGFMIGTTGTCYERGTASWRGMLLLSLARGGWVNTYYGNLDLLSDTDGAWFAKAQSLFYALQEHGKAAGFGGQPEAGEPYGWSLTDQTGALLTVLNPSQVASMLILPGGGPARVLFHDAGFEPQTDGQRITLGAGQMAVIGTGAYATHEHDLGTQEEPLIPQQSNALHAESYSVEGAELRASIAVPEGHALRVIVRQFGPHGQPLRTTGGDYRDGTPVGQLLRLELSQEGRVLGMHAEFDKRIWSGISWVAAEVDADALRAGTAVDVLFHTVVWPAPTLRAEFYAVRYS